jgi:glycosyltransferase involved in cell wall biosynthesis
MSAKKALVCGLMPECDRDSGSRRTADLIAFLQEAGWSVTFVSHHEKHGLRYIRDLQRRGVAVYSGSKIWMERLLATGHFDLVVLILWTIAEAYVPLIRRNSPSARIIVDSVDVHFLRESRRALQDTAVNGGLRLLDDEYASKMLRELNTYVSADAVLAVSQKEADLIDDLSGDPSLAHEVPISEDLAQSPVPFAERAGILYLGCFRHMPNVGAVEHLCKCILPEVDKRLLAAHPVFIVGDGLNETVRGYGDGLPHVRMVGWVPSALPYLQRSRITVVPVLYGAGVKGKLVQALMVGTPSVSTSIGAEGLNLRAGEHVLIADDPTSFAKAISRLLQDQDLWQNLSQRGRDHITAISGRETVRRRFLEIISAVRAKAPKPLIIAKSVVQQAPTTRDMYPHLIRRIREVVKAAVPATARVMVVSKGDNELLRLDGRAAWHFPRAENGEYAGFYPSDSAAAIAHLETLRAQGGDYLLFPSTAFWWLEHYREFKEHLERRYPEIGGQRSVCLIYALCEQPGTVAPPKAAAPENGALPSNAHPANRPAITGPASVDLAAPAHTVPNRTVHLSSSGARTVADGAADRPEARLIAFFLPQFHPIVENDAWWGKGFTEWTNVAKAQPLFPGHYQPHLPADLGFYDLRLAETRQAQADLAKAYGIHGFCYYHYWFNGKRLLERPFAEVLGSGRPDFPFCLCWANEPWSRRWDGSWNDVLQPQVYSEEDDAQHISWLIQALQDPRAITIDGKPLFLVYRAQDLPHPVRTVEIWRRHVNQAGLKGIYLVAVESGEGFNWDATRAGFDAKVLFQPHFRFLLSQPRLQLAPGKWPAVYDYQEVWPILANPKPVSYKRYEAVFPFWDNSPRKGKDAIVLHNSTPQAYVQWLTAAVQRVQDQPPDERIVFLNAWNEWAEGCHLEPDQRHGLAYLEATRNALLAPTRVKTASSTMK